MRRGTAAEWLRDYARAWEGADLQVVDLFTEDATYRSHVFREPHAGHDGIRAYWETATSTQQDVRVLVGEPLIEGDRVVAEWWTTMTEEEGPVALPGVLLLDFEGRRCRALREYWALAPGHCDPFPGWGRVDQAAGAKERADAWAAAYRRAWEEDDARAAAETFAEDVSYRTHPFRDAHEGRDAVQRYTERAYASERDRRVIVATAAAEGGSAAVEYWATFLEDGTPKTLAGCVVGSFDDVGRMTSGRDYWHEEEGTFEPPR